MDPPLCPWPTSLMPDELMYYYSMVWSKIVWQSKPKAAASDQNENGIYDNGGSGKQCNETWSLYTVLAVGVTKPNVSYWISRLYLAGVAAAQLRCAMTPVKYECDSGNLTGTFARSKILLTEKLANGALVTPTPRTMDNAEVPGSRVPYTIVYILFACVCLA